MPGYPTDRTSIWYDFPFTIGTSTPSVSVGGPDGPRRSVPDVHDRFDLRSVLQVRHEHSNVPYLGCVVVIFT